MRIRWTRPAVATTGVLGLCASATTGTAAASTSATAARSGWRVVATANAALNVGIAPGKTSFWALGSVFVRKTAGGPIRPSGLHWNGRRWSKVTFPASVKSGIGCAGASSAGNVWAFAGSTLSGGFAQYAGALQLVRGKWQVRRSFTPPGLVSGCSVLGNGNAWLYGLTHTSPGVGTWRLRGAKWSRVQTGKFDLVTGSEVRADDVWAVGADYIGTNDVVAHWNGRSWTRISGLAKAVSGPGTKVQLWLNAINAVSRGNVWVAGQLMTGSGANDHVTNIVLHLSGGKWHKVAPGSAGYYLPARCGTAAGAGGQSLRSPSALVQSCSTRRRARATGPG